MFTVNSLHHRSTSDGRDLAVQHTNNHLKVQQIGITVQERQNMEFAIDIRSITAVAVKRDADTEYYRRYEARLKQHYPNGQFTNDLGTADKQRENKS
jgi:hypothetical protein